MSKEYWFPPVEKASKEGLLAIGGDLSIERLLLAYNSGIFPWFNEGDQILWWSPDPRFVLFPKDLKVSTSMRQFQRNTKFKTTWNKKFEEVINFCATMKRKQQDKTWITKDMVRAYCNLHKAGKAHSIEVWDDNQLVGGLYGVAIRNKIFSGESMFSLKNNTSKLALITLVNSQKYKLIDCQVFTNHLETLGAKHISREKFLSYLD